MDFQVCCIYMDESILIDDYAKDFLKGRGTEGLTHVFVTADAGPNILVDTSSWLIKVNNSNFIRFCVNINGYLYSVGEDILADLVSIIPIKTACVSGKKSNACVDKHVEFKFRGTKIKHPGLDSFSDISDKNITFSKYLKVSTKGYPFISIT